jgi:phosphopantothenoylcysteine decarboxylase/phosphopantothenate--cysteine ligase
VLATKAPVLLAPSMNVNMWSHPITRANVRRLMDVARHQVVGPGDGFLACRWTGPGRLAEPADIVEAAARVLSPQDLAGRHVVVTAGPTHEPVDPVRYLGNRSSGKMGYALAAAAARRGASVTLISGPVALEPPPGLDVIRVEDARAMHEAVVTASTGADAVIMAAAVADFRPTQPGERKLKRSEMAYAPSIALDVNPDILAALGAARAASGSGPVLIGFAAETHDVAAYARAKLRSKGVDLVVANDVTEPGSGFAVDTNRVVLVDAAGDTEVPPASKAVVAHRILDRVAQLVAARGARG